MFEFNSEDWHCAVIVHLPSASTLGDFVIKGIIFDLDGTLVDSGLTKAVFAEMREVAGIPPGLPILETISSWPDDRRNKAISVIEEFEKRGLETAKLLPGAEDLLNQINECGIKIGIFSRNSMSIVEGSLNKFKLNVNAIVSRDCTIPKPHPAGILMICKQWNLTPADILMVGDYLFDIEAGKAAGSRTALITWGQKPDFENFSDYTFADLSFEHFLKVGLIKKTPNL